MIKPLPELQAEAAAIAAIRSKPFWTIEDVAVIIGRSPYTVARLFTLGIIKRNAENLSCEAWVNEYLMKPIEGKRKSMIRPRSIQKT